MEIIITHRAKGLKKREEVRKLIFKIQWHLTYLKVIET